jgi:hypothetical protein
MVNAATDSWPRLRVPREPGWLAPRRPRASYLDPVISGEPLVLPSKALALQGYLALTHSGFEFLCLPGLPREDLREGQSI